MKLKRHTSKRVPLARKYNLQKKVKAHNEKLKKHARKLKLSGVVSNRKRGSSLSAISIPNAWPHKRELLLELQKKKEEAVQEKIEARRRKKAGIPEPITSVDTPIASYEQLLAQSAERAHQFEIRTNATAALEEKIRTALLQGESREIAQSRKKFYDDLLKVVHAADVVLIVLDARDPEGCRSEKLETEILASGKRLVFVLNKIDLVPAEVVEAWLAFYRKIAPTMAFKACLTAAGKAARKAPLTAGPLRGNEEIYQASSANYGADKLIELLKQYSRTDLGTSTLSVGIVGFPNVGKSSIINTLAGLRRGYQNQVVRTGNKAGLTSQIQEVQLDGKITLIDSAGVVFPSSIVNNDASLILRRAINVDSLRDPVGTVERLINHRGVTQDGLCQLLRVPAFANAQDLIRYVAQVHGKVKRRGGADMEASARFILNRVSDGKVHFYTMPPESQGPPGGFAYIVNPLKEESGLF